MRRNNPDANSFPVPNIILKIGATYSDIDMSVPIVSTITATFTYDELQGKKSISTELPDVGTLDILSLSPGHIDVKWHDEAFSLDLGEVASSEEYGIDDPDSSYEGSSIIVEYADISDYKHTLELVDSITLAPPEPSGYEDPAITQKKKMALFYIDNLIDNGYDELLVLKALLVSSDNWDDCEVIRKKPFRKIMREALEMDCLAPDSEFAWTILELALTNNDSKAILSERVLKEIRNLAKAAAEADNEHAKTILTLI